MSSSKSPKFTQQKFSPKTPEDSPPEDLPKKFRPKTPPLPPPPPKFAPKTPPLPPPKKFAPKTPPLPPPPKFAPKTPEGSPPKFAPKTPEDSPPKFTQPKFTQPKFTPLHHPAKKQLIENIFSANDALYIAKPYIQNIRQEYDAETKDQIEDLFDMNHTNPVPNNTHRTRWRMTEEALKNTINYIFNKLSHTCYMLCVSAKGKGKIMYKLSSPTSSPSLQKAITHGLQNLDKNTLITNEQRQYIREFASGPVRIMQCVMKHFDNEKTQTENEYLTLLHDVIIPEGVYILNLTDAVILHNHNEEPFPSVTGKKTVESQFDKSYFIPILSLSGKERYSDIPIPNYDDVQIALGIKDIQSNEFITNWEDKKIHKAIFRGGPAGCGYTVTTNQRLKLITMRSPLIDAKIVSKSATIDSKAIKFDPKYGLGMMNTGIKPGNFVSMQEQSNYKYIIHVDGNVNAYRLLTTMLTGSLILKVQSEYTSWVEHLIESHVHYIHVNADLSDLVKQIEWCERNPHLAKKIATAGKKFAEKALTLDYVKNTIQKICWGIPRLFSVYDPHRNRYNKQVTPELPDKPFESPKTPEGSPPKTPKTPEGSPPKSPKTPTGSPPKSPKTPTGSPPKDELRIKIPKDSHSVTQKRIKKKTDDEYRFQDAKTPEGPPPWHLLQKKITPPRGFGTRSKKRTQKRTQKRKPLKKTRKHKT